MDEEHKLEKPRSAGDLYRARGGEVEPCRPLVTGDVYDDIDLSDNGEAPRKRPVIVLQHPCSLRVDGVKLSTRILVAKVQQHAVIDDWTGHGKLMPLPELQPDKENPKKRHYAAMFDQLYLVPSKQLNDTRIACMSTPGINLLLQRWVFHSTRAVIPTVTFNSCNVGVYEETDLTEDWCTDRQDDGIGTEEASGEILNWLREEREGLPTRQDALRDAQLRSSVRKEMRQYLRTIRSNGATDQP